MEEDKKKSAFNYVLNITIIILGLICVYLIFSFISKSYFSKTEQKKEIMETPDTTKTKQQYLTIQIDIQNGTGDNGVGVAFMDFLRKKGLDVVDVGNYKSSDVNNTMILSRSGSKKKALKVAEILGVSEKRVLEQINTGLLLDVTVVIGRDYNELKPYTEKIK